MDIVSVLTVFSGFLLRGLAFWLSKPVEERGWKLNPQAGRGGSVTRAGTGVLLGASGGESVPLLATLATACSPAASGL